MANPRCDVCRFHDEPTSECRRNAPVASVTSDLSATALAFWPEVKPDDWCGEHSPDLPAPQIVEWTDIQEGE